MTTTSTETEQDVTICSQLLDATLRTYPESTYNAAEDPYATEYDR